ncbi:MAG: bifunctional metallophosphatase/5'-nucleotidase [Microbacter sp.]
MKFNKLIILFAAILVMTACASQKEVVILCTNDTHSQILPNEENLGGYARIAGIIDTVRAHHRHVILLDDGDFSQGTPFFNLFKGDVEIAGMNLNHYDAVTLGNHEFDNGVDQLAEHLKKAKFSIVNANYDVSNTALKNMVKPYIILKKAGLKIGIFGLGVSPDHLITDANFKGIRFENPVQRANEISKYLKTKVRCDAVICVSHLGTDPNAPFSDWSVARQSTYIDVITGGHSHQVINKKVLNAVGDSVQIIQDGKSGVYIGRINLIFKR